MRRAPVVTGLAACITGLLAIAPLAGGVPQVSATADPSVSIQSTDTLPGILVSRQLLEAENLSVNEIVSLSGDASANNAHAFRIVGVYEPVPNPLRISQQRLEARLHLPDLLDLTDDPSDPLFKRSVAAVNVALEDPADTRSVALTLDRQMPGLRAVRTQLTRGRNTFVVLERFHLAIAIVTVIASTAFLLALMVMHADERRETAAILRLLGFAKRRVLLQVFIEGLCIAGAGAAFGILLAVATQGLFNRFFQWRYDTALVFVRISPTVAWQCVALAVPLGVLASIAASWTLLRREILLLIRR